MKDPIALFSAEWLADTFDMDVVVLIRHPAAFAASIARLSWRFDFRNFVTQPSLMEGDLAPFAAEIESAACRRPTLINEAALVWKCIYATVDRYRAERPAWKFVRHEDLLMDPASGFQAICEHTRAPFSAPVAETLRRTSSSEKPVDAPPGTEHSLMRDSRAMTHHGGNCSSRRTYSRSGHPSSRSLPAIPPTRIGSPERHLAVGVWNG